MSYKTLIIVDNSSEVTSLNQETIKETLKYFVSNLEKDDKVAIAVTGETAEYVTDYDDTLNTQLKTIEQIEYKDITAPGSDVLMEVILNWKEEDFAYRDIIYVGAKELEATVGYSEEELLFEIDDKQYPIYTLACVQNENETVMKSLNLVSRVSGGKSICTTDAKSDAEVEKQLSNLLMEAMREKRKLEEEKYENSTEEEDLVEEEEQEQETDATIETEEICMEQNKSESIIYEKPQEVVFSKSVESLIIMAALFLMLGLLFFVSLLVKNKRNKKTEEEFKEQLKNRENKNSKRKAPFDVGLNEETVCLTDIYENDDEATKLLYQAREGVEITLEDRSDPTKFFRVLLRDSIVIGRSERTCDVALPYDNSVSSRHCELSLREGNVYCRDLGSSNGTMVNQQKVYQEIKVESGDILRIGRLSLFIQILGDSNE